MPLATQSQTLYTPVGVQPLKLCHVHAHLLGTGEDWRRLFERCRELGFNHVVVSGLFGTEANREPLTLGASLRTREGSESETGASFGTIEGLCRLARNEDLGLWLDVRPDRRAFSGALFAKQPELGVAAEAEHRPIDPRGSDLCAPGAPLDFGEPGLAELLAGAWASALGDLCDAGVAGFRWLEPAKTPSDVAREIVRATRARFPDARFLAWTIGVSAVEVERLAGIGWNAVVSSFPWWDFRADWFFEETERLSRLGTVLHPVVEPVASTSGVQPALPIDVVRARRTLWTAAALGGGSFVPMEFHWPLAEDDRLGGEMQRLHAWLDAHGTNPGQCRVTIARLCGPAAALSVVARREGLKDALVVAINPTNGPAEMDASEMIETLREPCGRLVVLETRDNADSVRALSPGSRLHLEANETALLRPLTNPPVVPGPAGLRNAKQTVESGLSAPRIAIEAVAPQCDQGRFAIRRVVGELVEVEADVWIDGHIQPSVALRWRAVDAKIWHEARMRPLGNDRYGASFPLDRLGRYEFSVEAWVDAYANWVDELEKKKAAGQNLDLETAEGHELVMRALDRGQNPALKEINEAILAFGPKGQVPKGPAVLELLLDPTTRMAMISAGEKAFLVRTAYAFPVEAERRAARFASWYELFPRSFGPDAATHGRLTDVIARLPAIRAMGFDVLYFPPIHPVGKTHRKGPNNALQAGPEDPGSPYAIGGDFGGHTAIHPELGGLEDLRTLIAAAASEGIELALDYAIQCSPDHPWLREHPEWFQFRPDGSVRYAENPPKKYEDIVNVDFYTTRASTQDSAPAAHLWLALRDIVLFWVEQGIRIFRVDNPHTKPLPFWEWMIQDVRSQYPDVIFLAEAFTRPKMMARLAKLGFSQSYTYFTWRHTKAEFTDYLTELTQTELAQYFRPHFFVNTPDINPYFLQTSGRPGFLIRAALATLLSGLWGMYSGFELCESDPLPGKEEYADSEKYQFRKRDFTTPGNIIAEIARLNAIRHENPALQSHLGLRFYNAFNDRILYFGKATPSRDNVILAAICLDPFAAQEADIEIPLWEFGLPDSGSLAVEDLFESRGFEWHGKIQHLRLDPYQRPFAVWRIQKTN
ncbi:MAG: alpha-1,4-glucan--maltose-1-phosphate maltosyltransferase [Burkholderiaceae bacterium]